MHEHSAPVCGYCRQPAVFYPDSRGVYHGVDYGPVWACLHCGAWVGVHKGTTRPLGRLADRTLRGWKRRAHLAFDPLWRHAARAAYPELANARTVERLARTRAYLWLGEQLALPPAQCHIGLFDIPQCQSVIEIIATQHPSAQTIRAWAQAQSLREEFEP